MSDAKQDDATWYGELYAIHKLKVAAARLMLLAATHDVQAANAEYSEARKACEDLGLTHEILLERLKT